MSKKKGPPETALDPHRMGRSSIKQHGSDPHGRRTLRFHRGEWFRWQRGRYRPVSRVELMAEISRFLKQEIDTKGLVDSNGNAYRVTTGLVNNVLNALAGELLVPDSVDPPAMLGGAAVTECLAFENGLVSVATVLEGKPVLKPLTPEWFSPVVFPYEFDPAATCPQWLEFLTHVLEGDAERVNLVQEWSGYCLVPDTSLHGSWSSKVTARMASRCSSKCWVRCSVSRTSATSRWGLRRQIPADPHDWEVGQHRPRGGRGRTPEPGGVEADHRG